MHDFDVRGITRVFDLQFNQAGWSMVNLDPEFSQRITARFTGPDAMDTNGDVSKDRGATWQHDLTMRYTRLG